MDNRCSMQPSGGPPGTMRRVQIVKQASCEDKGVAIDGAPGAEQMRSGPIRHRLADISKIILIPGKEVCAGGIKRIRGRSPEGGEKEGGCPGQAFGQLLAQQSEAAAREHPDAASAATQAVF